MVHLMNFVNFSSTFMYTLFKRIIILILFMSLFIKYKWAFYRHNIKSNEYVFIIQKKVSSLVEFENKSTKNITSMSYFWRKKCAEH